MWLNLIKMLKKNIGIIMGDAAGIGPEIIIKSLTNSTILYNSCNFIVIGSFEIMQRMNNILGDPIEIVDINEASYFNNKKGKIIVIDCEVTKNKHFRWGVSSSINGKNSIAYILKGLDLAQKEILDGLVIAPLNKQAMHEGGCKYSDESVLMKNITKASWVNIVNKWNSLFRSTVVGHIRFRDILENLREDTIIKTTKYLRDTIKIFTLSEPRIGIASLNPHAGEGGGFGDEEKTIIEPVINKCKKLGYLVNGPYPADTIFHRALRGDLDGIVYLHHDQGNIAMKAAAFGKETIIYVGLPFCVTGPGHGTAYGHAGKGNADPHSFQLALEGCNEIITKQEKII